MKCFKPILIGKYWEEGYKYAGSKNDTEKRKYELWKKYPKGIWVDCGKCDACLERKKKEYIFRYLAETKDLKYKHFLTLTYNEENINKKYSVDKKLIIKYIKKVREYIRRNYTSEIQWKYFLASEYGDRTLRPHYHMVIASDSTVPVSTFKKYWTYGNVDCQEAETIKSVFYTIGYTEKKQGKGDDPLGREKVFRKFSKSLGRERCIENFEQLEKYGVLYQGFSNNVPKYYKKVWEQEGLIDEAWKEQKEREYKEREKKEMKELFKQYDVKIPKGASIDEIEYLYREYKQINNKERERNYKARMMLRKRRDKI